jgi:hypothetical protein
MARENKYGDIAIAGIPDTEPIIIFRAKDKLAPFVIDHYQQLAEDRGLADHAAAVAAVAREFRDWQARNADLVKLPD